MGSRERGALQRQRTRRSRSLAAPGLLCALLLAVAPDTRADEADRPPAVGLDQLLRVPDAVQVRTPRRGGATRSEWQARFRGAHEELERAQKALEAARGELEELASGTEAWQISAPGAVANTNPEAAPLSYRLRQELRRHREEVERAERKLQELTVEANLAGVPADWQTAGADDPQ